jgi:hypothetical protein
MPALQEFHDSTLYLIRAETAVDTLERSLNRGLNGKTSGSSFFLEKTYNRVFRLLGGIMEMNSKVKIKIN